jgi:hypothetical protein
LDGFAFVGWHFSFVWLFGSLDNNKRAFSLHSEQSVI